mmetsp:Transcript_21648/g.39736  ORF Transcript_21648/g.39736 Transcript_21648/m.39736 type:complete len:142 (-) Transcript_21648:51-476(-)|eukprot:CAMPEP_0201870130 /NCGR_PEP_ID=MMETSP0902-20130614/3357_1 /ASSEMBLY_ACC=CAM_ASM_000551 /TAXON_ID=420261 /ORGANISM="Thalassiosira antarctica, Strain CCMP982" /LENGTH=141 /DNA_ID=CAMNT_0048395705 /DNA_START=2101 /DNA_END=2526 /DNA_ORIENTATION=-
MHYAGDCYANNFIDNYFVVELLVEAAPQSVNIEDEDEMKPIEYALLNATHKKVIKMMQRASRSGWRKRKTEEHKSHEDLAKDVQGRSSPTTEDPQDKISHLAVKPIFIRKRHTLHDRLGASTTTRLTIGSIIFKAMFSLKR